MSDPVELLGLLRVLTIPAPRGPASPNPVELSWLISAEEVELHRRLRCRSYERCLDAAYRRRWRSFTCAACGVQAPAPEPDLEAAHAGVLRPGACW